MLLGTQLTCYCRHTCGICELGLLSCLEILVLRHWHVSSLKRAVLKAACVPDSLGVGKIISGILNVKNHQLLLGSTRVNVSDAEIEVGCDKKK